MPPDESGSDNPQKNDLKRDEAPSRVSSTSSVANKKSELRSEGDERRSYQTKDGGQKRVDYVVNHQNKFFIGKNEEQLPDKKNSSPVSRASSVASFEANTEVFLRPRPQYGNTLLSAVVSPSRNDLDLRKVNSTGDLQKVDPRRRPVSHKNKNENMVLRLVLPANNQSNNNDNYFSAKSIDDILENGHLKERRSRPATINGPQEYLPTGSYINRAYSTYDPSEYGQPIGSPGSYSIIHTPVTPVSQDNPTPDEEKNKAFVKTLTTGLSIIYGLFIVVLGLSVFISDYIHADQNNKTAKVFSLILVSGAFLYILFLTVDISWYMRKKKRYEKLMERNIPEQIEMKENANGSYQFNITLPQVVTLKKSLDHHYCLNKDRHSTNFYLKLGAAAFCFGHLIHSCLILGYQIVFLASDEFYDCGSVVQLIVDISYPVYSFLLLFFIFKFSNVIINRYSILARFGIMHCLSSSICFWVWTIYREILEALAYYDIDKPDEESQEQYSQSLGLPSRSDVQPRTKNLSITPMRFTVICNQEDTTLSEIYNNYSPYLYPFSVEFSILVVGVLFLVWQNIGMCKAEDEEDESSTRQCRSPSGNRDNMESNVVVHVDCQSSSKGIFGGFSILILTIVSTILFFIAIYTNDGSRGESGIMINIVTSLIILVCMTLTSILGYRQITKLDLNTAHHKLLDDVLLFICLPAFFLNGVFSIVPAVFYKNVLGSINVCLEVFQVLLQTCFLLDGVRRSSNTKELRKKKHGREMVIFLLICNVALWLMQTFEVKSHGMQDNRYDFYGKELWTILGHMCLPLMMFYRFHASVCFGDIWKYAYEPSGH